MAIIQITATRIVNGGPEVPSELAAFIRQRDWPGGGTTSVLYLSLGRDEVQIHPACPEYIAQLAGRLLRIAGELKESNDDR